MEAAACRRRVDWLLPRWSRARYWAPRGSDAVAAARGARRPSWAPGGFRKRVVYLEGDVVAASLVGAAVDGPLIDDERLRRGVSGLDRALVVGDDLRAEERLAVVVERLTWHLTGRPPPAPAAEPAAVARWARDVLDGDPVAVGGIAVVAAEVGVSTAHLVRSFTHSYGIPPHRYLLGRNDLDLVGIGLHGPKNVVDKIVKGVRLHR